MAVAEDSGRTSTASLHDGALAGRLLVAMPAPAMRDPRFEKSVIYICAHSEDGAMGIIVNKPAEHISFPELLAQLNIPAGPCSEQIRVHLGGPVETSRGFVLHSTDYFSGESTMAISERVGLTATIDILRAVAEGTGPEHALLALGYAGWGPGQLEAELKANGWLNCPASDAVVFSPEPAAKWELAMGQMGITPSALSSVQGTA